MTPVTVEETDVNGMLMNTQKEDSSKPKGAGTPTMVADVDDPSHPLFHHRRTVSDFEIGEILGEGSYSTVLIGRDHTTGKTYAIKKLDKAHIVKNDKVKYVMIERDALSRMNHPGIVKLYWTFKDNRSLYYVLDLAPNGELYTYIRRLAPFDIPTARFYAAEILSAIDHIHSKGVIHRDIKPENILLDENMHIKITDFGSAKILSADTDNINQDTSSSKARSFVGTAEYVSPELLRSDPTSKEADLWAFGCVIFQMISGRSPFKAATDYLIFQKIKNLDYTFPDDFDPVAKDLVQHLLCLDPAERLGSDGIEFIQQHEFFKGVDWEHLFKSEAPAMKERLDAVMEQKAAHADGPEPHDELDLDWSEDDRQVPERNVNPFADEANTIEKITAPVEPAALSRYKDSQHQRVDSTSSTVRCDSPERLGNQKHPSWSPHLFPNESILHAGRVARRGLFNKKRYLILTDRPRLLYMDEGDREDGSGGELRCEIGWTPQLLPELKGSSVFSIHTPEKSYTFETSRGLAEEWVHKINTMLVNHFGVTG